MLKLKNIIDFLQLLLIIGLPRIPGTNIPLAVIILLLNYKVILKFHALNKTKILKYYFILTYLVVLGLILASGTRDLVFYLTIILKILFGFYTGVLAAKISFKSPVSFYMWLIFQSLFVVMAAFSTSFFDFLAQLIPSSSFETMSGLYGKRSLGFGIFHSEGAVLLALLSMFPLAYNLKGNRLLKNRAATIFTFLCSLLLGRTALVPAFLFFLFRNIKGLLLAVIFSVIVGYISVNVTSENVLVYEATELFRNLINDNSLNTKSTNANLRMFVLPGDFSGFLHGYGKFFQANGSFYEGTDLGWIRLLLFGGVFVVIPFILANIFWWPNGVDDMQGVNYRALLLLVFFVVNFKGLFVFSFVFAFSFYFSNLHKIG